MEYCEGGPLSKIDCETITENDLKWYLAQIVLGVEYLHKNHIIHRVSHTAFKYIGFEVSKYPYYKKWEGEDC